MSAATNSPTPPAPIAAGDPATAAAVDQESGSVADRFASWWQSYWLEPMPMARLRVFSRIIYGMVLLSILKYDGWVLDHGWAPRGFWQPIGAARIMHIPAPTVSTIGGLQTVTAIAAVISIIGTFDWLSRTDAAARRMRTFMHLSNFVVFAGMFVWLVWAFSWAKVDHDRFTIVIALAALVVVPGIGHGLSREAGWALRTVQVVFIVAYPLSAFAKFRKSGILWANGATFTRAIVRRGTLLGKNLLEYGMLLKIGQWAFVIFEVAAGAALWRNNKVRVAVLLGVVGLHLFTWLAIDIHFLPHSICITAFLPLERLTVRWNRDQRAAKLAAATTATTNAA